MQNIKISNTFDVKIATSYTLQLLTFDGENSYINDNDDNNDNNDNNNNDNNNL